MYIANMMSFSSDEIKAFSYRGTSTIQRFWGKVKKFPGNRCWLWTGYCSRFGYGMLMVRGQIWLAHRFSWVIHNGNVPLGLYTLHRCDVRNCVNPAHLFLGTYRDNNRDCVLKGRHKCLKGSDVAVSKLTEYEVNQIRRLYSQGWKNKAEIGRQYGVSDVMIGNIVKRRWWKHI